MTGRTAGIVIALLFVTGCAPRTVSAPAFCEIASAPETFAHRELTVEGDLLMSRHGHVITNAGCEAGVGVGWRGEGPQLARLNDFARRWELDPALRARVSVIGRMVREETEFAGMQWRLDVSAGEILGPVRGEP